MLHTILIVSIICLLFSLFSYLAFGREEKVFTSIQTEPPHGLNPLEIGLIYNKKALPGDAVAILHYLASKDYLKIVRSDKSRDIILTKLKKYDGNNAAEKFIFENVFAGSNEISVREIKENRKLSPCFQVAAMAVNSDSNIGIYFEVKSLKAKNLAKKLNYISLILINILIYINGFLSLITLLFLLPFVAVFSIFQGIGLYVIGSGSESEVGFGPNDKIGRGKSRVKNNMILGFFLIIFTAFIVVLIIISQRTLLSATNTFLLVLSYIIGLILLCISQLIASNIDKKSSEGIRAYQEITGFKNYLDKAERPMMEQLFLDSPSVFRKVVSFGFVLGVSKKWTRDFDMSVFNGIFTAAYGYSDDGSESSHKTDAERKAAAEKFRKMTHEDRANIQNMMDGFNKMIEANDLNLFGRIYKEPLRMSDGILDRWFFRDEFRNK